MTIGTSSRLRLLATAACVLLLHARASADALWLGNDHLNTTILQTSTTGTVLQTVTVGNNTGLAIDPVANELFLSARTGGIQVRDLTTLAIQGTIPSPGSATNYEDLAWDGTSLYRADFFGAQVFRIDRTTGAETLFVSGFSGPVGVAYDSSDNTFWITSFILTQLRHYDASGMQLGSSIPLSLSGRAGGLGYDPTDDTLWLGSDERVFHITKGGGILGFFDTPEFGAAPGSRFVDGLEFERQQIQAVPEPASLVLLSLGVGGLLISMRLWRKRAHVAAPLQA